MDQGRDNQLVDDHKQGDIRQAGIRMQDIHAEDVPEEDIRAEDIRAEGTGQELRDILVAGKPPEEGDSWLHCILADMPGIRALNLKGILYHWYLNHHACPSHPPSCFARISAMAKTNGEIWSSKFHLSVFKYCSTTKPNTRK